MGAASGCGGRLHRRGHGRPLHPHPPPPPIKIEQAGGECAGDSATDVNHGGRIGSRATIVDALASPPDEPLRFGVIGYGYWGPNLARNFAELPGAALTAVADQSPLRREAAKRRFPWVTVHGQASDLIRNPNVDAVAVATPVVTHYMLAQAALEAGKHVLVEKPISTSSEEVLHLIEEAERRGLVLMVDHTFVYTGAVRKIHDLVQQGTLGQLYYYDSVRANLGLFQTDVNVMWDLGVHDLSIIDRVMAYKPTAVAAHAFSHVPGHPANIAYITLRFPENQVAHLHVNWLAPVKVRTTLISGSASMIVYNDVEPSEKVKTYDKGAMVEGDPQDRYQQLVKYRLGDMSAPQLDTTEALSVEIAHFIDCVRRGSAPLTDGWSGYRVVKILEAAERSSAAEGQLVALNWD